MEEWKDIPNFPGYMASTEGNIKRLAKQGNNGRFYPEAILSYHLHRKGYKRLALGGVKKFIHTLVALTFIPNPESKDQVNHKDGNKLNNNALNLEWVTCKENMIHAFATGLGHSGSKNVWSKLSEENVSYILKTHTNKKKTIRELSKEFNVSFETIRCVIKGKTYINERKRQNQN